MMGNRVSAIARDGWTGTDCALDVPRLVSEQVERDEMAAAALSRTRPTDWNQVRASLRELSR
jgi:hypothetical protein